MSRKSQLPRLSNFRKANTAVSPLPSDQLLKSFPLTRSSRNLLEINMKDYWRMRKLVSGALLLVWPISLALGVLMLAALSSTGLASPVGPQSASDNSLATVRQSDRAIRTADGKLTRLPANEHLRRANIYMT